MTAPDPATIELRTHAEGFLLPVDVHPGARRGGVTGIHDGRLRVSVTAAPDKGRANRALLVTLADALGIRRSQLSLAFGSTSRRKQILVAGIRIASLRNRLRTALDG